MAKVPKVRTALDELREYADSLAPQRGFFSTLDELIKQAPFERGTADQWRGYLQPGRMLKRDEAQFPLKKEEIEYALERALRDFGPDPIDRESLLKLVRDLRPEFGLDASTTSLEQRRRIALEGLPEWNTTRGERTRYMPAPKWGPGQGFPRLSHQSPGSTYEESVTRLANLDHQSHFTPDTLSWSRTSSHALPSGERMRLVEEIQSDLHQQAADKVPGELTPEEQSELDNLRTQARVLNADSEIWNVIEPRMEELENLPAARARRRGYRDDALLAKLENDVERIFRRWRKGALPGFGGSVRNYGSGWDIDSVTGLDRVPPEEVELVRQWAKARSGLPDAPFKNPADYGRLELRKQLLNAVNNDEDYLALTPGEVQVERYLQAEEGSAEGTRHVYDKVYRSELEKLARQYGAEVVEVPLAVRTEVDIRPAIMRRRNAEDAADFVTIALGREDAVDQLQELIDELDVTGRSPYADEAIDALNDLEDLIGEGMSAWTTSTEEWELLEEIEEELVTALTNLWNEFQDSRRDVHQQVKTFPAIKLTPEVKERVKRIGVPLWSLVGGAAVLEPLLGEEEPAEFAKGGRIRKKLDPNKRLLHQTDRTYLDSIREKGLLATPDEILLPDERPGVNLIYGNSMDDLYFGPLKNWQAVVEVDPTKLDPRKITFVDIDWLRYLDNIPPEALIEAWGPNTAPLWRKRKKFQEGGMVLPPGTTLEDLEHFGGWNPMEDLKRIAYGLGTQVIPYDVKTGQPSPGRGKPYRERESFLSPNWIYYDSLGREIWEDEYHRLRKLPPREVSVGIIDETLALPSLGSTVINAIAGKDVVGTPEFVERASANVQQMNDVFRENLGVSYSDSLKDLALESAGIMFGQVPIPGLGAIKAAGRGLGAAAKKIFGSPLEWFAPMIDPTVANYAVGTGAGALIQKYLPEYIESRDPNYRMASAIEAWEAAETDEERAQIEALPEFQQAIELMRQWEAEEEEARRAEIGMEPFADPAGDGENEFQSFFSEDGIIEDDNTGFAKGGRVVRRIVAKIDDGEGWTLEATGSSQEEAFQALRSKLKADLMRQSNLLGSAFDDSMVDGTIREFGVTFKTPFEKAKGGKVKGPSLLELREALKEMNLQAEIPDAGVDPSRAPVPVEPSLPTLEQIQEMVPGGIAQPEGSTRLDDMLGKVTRRDVLQGAGAMLSPLDPFALAKAVEVPPAVATPAVPMGKMTFELGRSLADIMENRFKATLIALREELIDAEKTGDAARRAIAMQELEELGLSGEDIYEIEAGRDLDDYVPTDPFRLEELGFGDDLEEEVFDIDEWRNELGYLISEAMPELTDEQVREIAAQFNPVGEQQFVETDSSNVSHGGAFYQGEFEGPQDIIDKINEYLAEEGHIEKEGMAKGGKVKGPSLLELREQLKQMNLDAEGPNVEGTGRELVPSTGGMLDPVQSGTPTLEQIEQLARQPEPERPGTVSRRDFLEGAAALMSPLPDPTSLITPNPFEGASLLDPATNVAKAIKPLSVSRRGLEEYLLAKVLKAGEEDPEFETHLLDLSDVYPGGIQDFLENPDLSLFDIDAHSAASFDEVSPAFKEMMKAQGIWIDEDGTIHYNPEGAQKVREESERISEWYDMEDDERARRLAAGETDPWKEYGLGGDDDVDYHGGYVQDLLELLDQYHNDVERGTVPSRPIVPTREELALSAEEQLERDKGLLVQKIDRVFGRGAVPEGFDELREFMAERGISLPSTLTKAYRKHQEATDEQYPFTGGKLWDELVKLRKLLEEFGPYKD